MSTVSLIECVAPASLRTCGFSASNRTLLEKRRRLQSTSPEKHPRLTPTPQPKVPHIRGVSMSPACVGSPVRAYAAQTKWPYECNDDDFNGSVSSEELSDEDLDEICGSQEVARMLSHCTHEDLLVVGSKPKLHSMFEVPVPVIKPPAKTQDGSQKQQTRDNADAVFGIEGDPEFDRVCTSPENPPPSPINFTPSSLDGFIVGGKKLQCPKRTNVGMSYNSHDFNPGFVKYPLFHCHKCEERVLDEEQSQTALQRRHDEFIRNRASPYKPFERNLMNASRLSHRSRPDSQPSILECEHDARSFFEIYTEKKKQKEQRELERKKRKSRIKAAKDHNEPEPEIASDEKSVETSGNKNTDVYTHDSYKQDANSTDTCGPYYNAVSKASLSLLKQQTKRRYNQALRESSESRQPSVTDPCSNSSRQHMWDISDLSSVQTVQEQDATQYHRPKNVTTSRSDLQASVLAKCQVRRCRSDIWPFQENQGTTITLNEVEKMEKLRPKTTMRNLGATGYSKLRLTPYCPLPELSVHGSVRNLGIQQSKSDFSASSSSSYHLTEAEEIEIEAADENVSVRIEEDSTNDDITLTTTVIVPPKDKPCSQWITFNTDHEPVLNNAPITNEGCDNFLKRLQSTKLYLQDSGTPIPSGQFCYEPVIDKRYNRWKRRRRKKKDIESRRPTITVESDSSDDDNERQMERIIGRMYVEINGPPPETPNGTSDTPRMRNRRRRRELASESDTKLTDNSDELHYDASSEWIVSDASDDELNTLYSHDEIDDGTPTNDLLSGDSLEHSNENYTKCKHKDQSQEDSASSLNRQALSVDFLQTVSPDSEQVSSPDCRRNIYVEFDRCPKATGAIQEQDQWDNNYDQDENQPLVVNRNSENRNTPEIEEELRRCFSGQCFSVDISEEPGEAANRDGSSCTDGMCIPYLDQYREEIMHRVKDSPTDEILNKDWLPDIPQPTCAGSGHHKNHKSDAVKNDKILKVRTPRIPDPISRLRGDRRVRLEERCDSVSSNSKVKTRDQDHTRLQIKLSTSKLRGSKDNTLASRKSRQLPKPKSPEEEPKSISRSGASCWSELGYNPKQPKSLGLVSVAGSPDRDLKFSSSPFKASLRPVRREPVKNPIKTDLKDFGILKRKVLSLPKITKTSKSQTVPSYQRRNSVTNIEDKAKEKDQKTGPIRRPKTMPQSQCQIQKNSNSLDPRAEFMFRDYYLRSLYNSKPHHSTQPKPLSSSIPAKQTIMTDRLDLGKKKHVKTRQSAETRSVSNLSFTRAFTFSMFDLPDFYKLYNKRIERQAR